MKAKLLGLLSAAVLALTTAPAAVFAAGETYYDNITGTQDGYDFELWKDNGTTQMTLLGNGAFECSWSNINNCLFRTGKKWYDCPSWESLGGIQIEFEADYHPDGNSYLCVYGWTKNPLVEYYIVETWGSWRPPGAESKGQITIDGGTYDVYVTDRIDQPSIEGNTTFKQYWSVRTTDCKRDSGTISVSDHFAAWESMGMEMGGLYEAALNVEGYQSQGYATVKKNIVTIGEGTNPDQGAEPVEADADGCFFHSTFEDGADSWSGRGDASAELTNNGAYLGSGGLYVSGRTDAWNGTARGLSTNPFQPGETFSFGAMVQYTNGGDTEEIAMTLQYDADGETHYDQVASVTARKGEWTLLSNDSFTIPAGATSMLLYIETPENLIDFYVDEAYGALPGVTPVEAPAVSETTTTTDAATTTTTTTTTSAATTTADQPSETTSESTPVEATMLGDVDCNGELGISDAILLSRLAAEDTGVAVSAEGRANADTDRSGSIGTEDTILLLRLLAGVIESF